MAKFRAIGSQQKICIVEFWLSFVGKQNILKTNGKIEMPKNFNNIQSYQHV